MKVTKNIKYFLLWLSMCVMSILILIFVPIIFINESQILYLFSSAAQVIAAIYGLIVTGYIFFRNELDKKVLEDESLDEIVSYLKKITISQYSVLA